MFKVVQVVRIVIVTGECMMNYEKVQCSDVVQMYGLKEFIFQFIENAILILG